MIEELSDIEQSVYDAIEEIQGIKRDSGQHPDFAMFSEVCNFLRPEFKQCSESDILQCLRILCRKGVIEYHLTVNRMPMFGVKNKTT